jgi:hypothetical protein
MIHLGSLDDLAASVAGGAPANWSQRTMIQRISFTLLPASVPGIPPHRLLWAARSATALRRGAFGGLALGVACGLAACSGSSSNGAEGPGADAAGKRDTEFKHEPCDLTSSEAETMHAASSTRPVIITVKKGGRPICRADDLNGDGSIDSFVYYDEQGRERRIENGFDHPDRPNEVIYLQGGVIVRKERETNNDGKIDTWDYYQNGQLVREERDTSGDGIVRQWWTFPQPGNLKCAVVVSDLDGNGKPEPESRVDLCSGQDAVAAGSAAARADAGVVDAGSPSAPSDAGATPSAPAEESTP